MNNINKIKVLPRPSSVSRPVIDVYNSYVFTDALTSLGRLVDDYSLDGLLSQSDVGSLVKARDIMMETLRRRYFTSRPISLKDFWDNGQANVVFCKTSDEAKKFATWSSRLGKTFWRGDSLLEKNYRSYIAYSNYGTNGGLESYIARTGFSKITFYEFKDLIFPKPKVKRQVIKTNVELNNLKKDK